MKKLKLEELGRPSLETYQSLPKYPVVVVLDNIRSALNVGSVFRTSDAFKVERVILCGITARPPHREILKTSLGAHESVAWEYTAKAEDAVIKLIEQGYHVWPVEQTDSARELQDVRMQTGEGYAFVFGHEVSGVSDEVIALTNESLEIPQFGTKHSLNVATAVGIVLWEYVRRVI